MEGNLSAIVLFLLSIILYLRAISRYKAPGGLYSEGRFNGGFFCVSSLRDIYLEGLVQRGAYFGNFTVLQVLTKDSVTVAVDAVVYFRIYNATMSITNVENANRSTRLLAQTTLRNVLGTKNLSEILGERESISDTMQVNNVPLPL